MVALTLKGSIRWHILKKKIHSSIKRLYRYDTAKGKLSPIARGIVRVNKTSWKTKIIVRWSKSFFVFSVSSSSNFSLQFHLIFYDYKRPWLLSRRQFSSQNYWQDLLYSRLKQFVETPLRLLWLEDRTNWRFQSRLYILSWQRARHLLTIAVPEGRTLSQFCRK